MRDIVVEVSGKGRATRETTFDVFAPTNLRLILRGYGPLPAVAAVEAQTGGWDAPGQTRTIRLSDGSRMREALTVVERPRHFAFVIDELTGPFRLLVRGMRGAWWFEPAPDGSPGETAAAPLTLALRLRAAITLHPPACRLHRESPLASKHGARACPRARARRIG